MADVLDRTRQYTASKTYRCHWCGQGVEAGETYIRRFTTRDGPSDETYHPLCWEALKRESDQAQSLGDEFLVSGWREYGKTLYETDDKEDRLD